MQATASSAWKFRLPCGWQRHLHGSFKFHADGSVTCMGVPDFHADGSVTCTEVSRFPCRRQRHLHGSFRFPCRWQRPLHGSSDFHADGSVPCMGVPISMRTYENGQETKSGRLIVAAANPEAHGTFPTTLTNAAAGMIAVDPVPKAWHAFLKRHAVQMINRDNFIRPDYSSSRLCRGRLSTHCSGSCASRVSCFSSIHNQHISLATPELTWPQLPPNTSLRTVASFMVY